jgi:hypothetical protein
MSNRLTKGIGLFGHLFTRKLRFDTNNADEVSAEGQISWNSPYGTFEGYLDGTQPTATILHFGQDVFYYVKADEALTRGEVVYTSGTEGASGHILARKFLADGTYPSKDILGIVQQTVTPGEFVHVLHFGEMMNFNTSDFNEGDTLFASTSTAGGLQNTVPQSPNNIVTVARALNKKNNGTLNVRLTFGPKLSENEEVLITNPQDGDVLTYESATGLWKNTAP